MERNPAYCLRWKRAEFVCCKAGCAAQLPVPHIICWLLPSEATPWRIEGKGEEPDLWWMEWEKETDFEKQTSFVDSVNEPVE